MPALIWSGKLVAYWTWQPNSPPRAPLAQGARKDTMKISEHAAQLAAALEACRRALHPGAIGLIHHHHGTDAGDKAADAVTFAQAALAAWDKHNAPAPKQEALL